MDIMKTIEPKSDQQNFDDYQGGPKTVTVSEVKVLNGGEQPVEVHLVEFPGRPFKPGKSMRRVLIKLWGTKSVEWVGRRLTLFGDPDVMFAGQKVGGIRIAAMSHIDGPQTIALTVTRAKREPFVVQPIASGESAELLTPLLEGAGTLAELQAAWHRVRAAGLSKNAALIVVKDKRKVALSDPAAPTDGEPT